MGKKRILLLALLFTLLISLNVCAEEEVKQKKFKATSNGWYRIAVDKVYDTENGDYIGIYTNKKYDYVDSFWFYDVSARMVYLKKGTYKITYYHDFTIEKVKLTTKYKNNYNPKNAPLIKNGTKIHIDNKPYSAFYRWYKVKVPNNKRIVLFTSDTSYIYDKTLYHVDTNERQDGYKETAQLKGGTYYICVNSYPNSYRTISQLILKLE